MFILQISFSIFEWVSRVLILHFLNLLLGPSQKSFLFQVFFCIAALVFPPLWVFQILQRIELHSLKLVFQFITSALHIWELFSEYSKLKFLALDFPFQVQRGRWIFFVSTFCWFKLASKKFSKAAEKSIGLENYLQLAFKILFRRESHFGLLRFLTQKLLFFTTLETFPTRKVKLHGQKSQLLSSQMPLDSGKQF